MKLLAPSSVCVSSHLRRASAGAQVNRCVGDWATEERGQSYWMVEPSNQKVVQHAQVTAPDDQPVVGSIVTNV